MDPKGTLDALRPSDDGPTMGANVGAQAGPVRRRTLDAEDIGAIITRHHNEGHSTGWDEGYRAGLGQMERARAQASVEGETLGILAGLKLAIDALGALPDRDGDEELGALVATLRETFGTVSREGLHGERKRENVNALQRKLASSERVGW